VKGLVLRNNFAREAASTIGGRVDPHVFVSRLAPVSIEDINELPLPAQDWVRVQTTFSGLCGRMPNVSRHTSLSRSRSPMTYQMKRPCWRTRSASRCARSCSRLVRGLSSPPVSARTRCSPPTPTSLSPRSRRVGTTPLEPWSKRDWLQDGPAVVYDTIGSTETVETSPRLLNTGGTLVVSGVEPPKRFEWTPLYFKELHVIGSNGFGIEAPSRCSSTPANVSRSGQPQ
jgi:hypothetical protein